MFEQLTDRAKSTMALANQEAHRLNHDYLGAGHLLLGLIKEGSGVGANVLKNLDVDLRKLRAEVERLLRSDVEKTHGAKKVIEYAIMEARNLDHKHVGTEHLLLGMLREGYGVAWQALQGFGVTIDKARTEIVDLLHDATGLEPFPVPAKLSFRTLPNSRDQAHLTDEQGKTISLPMRTDLASEIVKRYNQSPT